MLGRYIAGTLLILGVAMVMAPDSPERDSAISVARTEASPVALVTGEPQEMASAVRNSSDVLAERPAPAAGPTPTDLQSGVEAALAQALALDATEISAEAASETAPEQVQDVMASAEAPLPEAEEAEETVALLAGLTLDMDASTEPFLRLPELDAAPADAQESLTEPSARMMYVTGTRVNVRAGPSTQYRVVNTVAFGDSVELVAYEGQGWARIRIGDNESVGFMSRKFLENELVGG